MKNLCNTNSTKSVIMTGGQRTSVVIARQRRKTHKGLLCLGERWERVEEETMKREQIDH